MKFFYTTMLKNFNATSQLWHCKNSYKIIPTETGYTRMHKYEPTYSGIIIANAKINNYTITIPIQIKYNPSSFKLKCTKIVLLSGSKVGKQPPN